MEPRASVKIGVGVFVFVGLLLFAASIFFLGERGRLFSRQHPLHVFFSSAAGLREGAPVRLAGVVVGRVTEIQLPRPPERKVRVGVSVAGAAIESIRQDSVARIETLGFLGDKFVEISVGSPHEPPLPDGATLRAEDPADFAALIGRGQRVLGQAERIATAVETVLSTLQESKVPEAIGDVAQSARGLMASLDRGDGALPWLVKDPESKQLVRRTLGSVQGLATSAERGDGALAWLIQDPASRRLVQNLDRSAEALAALSAEAKDVRGLVHALLYDPEGGRLIERASDTLREVDGLLQAIREGEGAIPGLLFDPKSRRVMDNLGETSQHLNEISGRIARGEGTLGALLVDPTAYEDLTALLEGSRRSWILRTVIRKTMESGRAAQTKRYRLGLEPDDPE